MRGLVITIISAGIAGMAVWTWAHPPAGTPGTGSGALHADASGNIGIKTSAPATPLDVNGATTIRGILNMVNNKITSVLAPTAGSDAATKAYVDGLAPNGGLGGVAGHGRPGVTVYQSPQECANSTVTPNIKISRSRMATTWDEAPAVCPVGWWVCSAAQRDVNGSSSGYGTCGSGSLAIVTCNPASTNDELAANTSSYAWISDAGTFPNATGINTAGSALSDDTCNMLPVWCCSY